MYYTGKTIYSKMKKVWFKKGSCQLNVHKYWLTAKRTKSSLEKCDWVNLSARHDLNSVDWAVKHQTNQPKTK